MVHVDETTPVRGVLLTFFGRMTIYWKTVDGGGTQEFCEIEDYLDEKVCLNLGILTMAANHTQKF